MAGSLPFLSVKNAGHYPEGWVLKEAVWQFRLVADGLDVPLF